MHDHCLTGREREHQRRDARRPQLPGHPGAAAGADDHLRRARKQDLGRPDFTVSASATSGFPVSFAAGGTCTVSGQTVHITGAGSCTVTASQPGNASYLPAPSVARTFTIGKADRRSASRRSEASGSATPTSRSARPPARALPSPSPAGGRCTISGARVHLTAEGTCTIGASQAGNANYNAAPAVARSFTIGPRVAPFAAGFRTWSGRPREGEGAPHAAALPNGQGDEGLFAEAQEGRRDRAESPAGARDAGELEGQPGRQPRQEALTGFELCSRRRVK